MGSFLQALLQRSFLHTMFLIYSLLTVKTLFLFLETAFLFRETMAITVLKIPSVLHILCLDEEGDGRPEGWRVPTHRQGSHG